MKKQKSHNFIAKYVALTLSCVIALSVLCVPMSAQAASSEIDFSFVEQDIINWRAVYLPVIESKAGSIAKTLPQRQSKELTVADAITNIYDLLTDQNTSTTSARKTKKALYLYDVLNGNYTQNAVAAFLDHGYFTEYYSDLKKAGLLAADYKLPEEGYETSVQEESIQIKGSLGDTQSRSMIQTDSEYLSIKQLLMVAANSNDKSAVKEFTEKINALEETYEYKVRTQK